MTPAYCISQVDGLKHNNITFEQKNVWLTELDQRVVIEVLETHTLSVEEQAEVDAFDNYDGQTTNDIPMLIPDPYSAIYRSWLSMQIDEINRDMGSYNNNASQFNKAWQTYANFYNRTHMPLMQVAKWQLDSGNIWTIDPLS